ncbi:MAG TPA: hypothetical protein P5550_06075 [Bacteroidales bacterium]|nr:hypothetical protein [Bacteroidales bacterium]HRZ76381.1 hypothetical protein [Bacteroidales bacterium]
MTRARTLLYGLLALTMAYVSVQQHVISNVPWNLLPLYTLNKALAWTGLLLLAFIFSLRALSIRGWLTEVWMQERRALGKSAFNLLGLHALFTLLLFRTEYGMAFLWKEGNIRVEGIVSIVLGSLALGLLAWYSKAAGSTAGRPVLFQRLPHLLLLLALMHTTSWGLGSWFTSAAWEGALPPVSLMGALTALAGLWMRRLR